MTSTSKKQKDETFVLLDDSLSPKGCSVLFADPVEIVSCNDSTKAEDAIEHLVAAGRAGLYAAGFFSYELGCLLEPKLASLLPSERKQPLLWMGLFERPQRMDAAATKAWLAERQGGGFELEDLTLTWDQERYLEAFDKVIDYITSGDVYQINLTLKYLFDWSGNIFDLYGELRHKQRVRHGALINSEEFSVLSLSPELFLKVEDDEAETRPMKGTAPRGRTPEEDDALAKWLQSDLKSRAENLMIVDLLRNDLGRSALIGSVRVNDLFTVERYPTVLQMTSGISARLHPAAGLRELLGSLFPCGSITGAPKVRAMEVIRELEEEPRGIYTGAVGMIEPSGNLSFNVAIRSLWLDQSAGDGKKKGEMGIGSGVVFDSDGAAEYRECLLKAEFLTRPYQDFQLIETLRWEKGEYWLLSQHLERLVATAQHFLYPFDEKAVHHALENAAEGFGEECYRVRLTLSHDGEAAVTSSAITAPGPDTLGRFVLSEKASNSNDPFFYHKTTRRALYDGEHARLTAKTGCDEVFFINERGELTEGSRSNIFIERGGELLTPPIAAGILAGTFRRHLIEDSKRPTREKTLWPEDLKTADAVYMGNSVRGLVRVVPVA